MTIIDTNKDTVDPMGIPNRDTTLTNKSDGQKAHEQTAPTDAKQALRPAEDDDLFDNMPV